MQMMNKDENIYALPSIPSAVAWLIQEYDAMLQRKALPPALLGSLSAPFLSSGMGIGLRAEIEATAIGIGKDGSMSGHHPGSGDTTTLRTPKQVGTDTTPGSQS